ncbi:hypothetical protein BD779DRAFT_1467297 [Infundibulicybe gibba]|nr:hypothetical protein BD779DRAFT_1467297 [Infundibulicybe gibba]
MDIHARSAAATSPETLAKRGSAAFALIPRAEPTAWHASRSYAIYRIDNPAPPKTLTRGRIPNAIIWNLGSITRSTRPDSGIPGSLFVRGIGLSQSQATIQFKSTDLDPLDPNILDHTPPSSIAKLPTVPQCELHPVRSQVVIDSSHLDQAQLLEGLKGVAGAKPRGPLGQHQARRVIPCFPGTFRSERGHIETLYAFGTQSFACAQAARLLPHLLRPTPPHTPAGILPNVAPPSQRPPLPCAFSDTSISGLGRRDGWGLGMAPIRRTTAVGQLWDERILSANVRTPGDLINHWTGVSELVSLNRITLTAACGTLFPSSSQAARTQPLQHDDVGITRAASLALNAKGFKPPLLPRASLPPFPFPPRFPSHLRSYRTPASSTRRAYCRGWSSLHPLDLVTNIRRPTTLRASVSGCDGDSVQLSKTKDQGCHITGPGQSCVFEAG